MAWFESHGGGGGGGCSVFVTDVFVLFLELQHRGMNMSQNESVAERKCRGTKVSRVWIRVKLNKQFQFFLGVKIEIKLGGLDL